MPFLGNTPYENPNRKDFYKLMRAEEKPGRFEIRRLSQKQIEIFKAEVSRIRAARLAAGEQLTQDFRDSVSKIRAERIAA